MSEICYVNATSMADPFSLTTDILLSRQLQFWPKVFSQILKVLLGSSMDKLI